MDLGPQPRVPLPKGTTKQDVAEIVAAMGRDGLLTGVLSLTDKDHVPGINAALKAQTIIDTRAREKAKTGQTLELVAGLRAIMLGQVPMPALDDGKTIDGAFEELDADDE